MRAVSTGLPVPAFLRFSSASARWIDKRRAHRALGVVLVRDRIAEQRHQPVAELLRHMTAHLRHRRRGGIEIGADEVAPLLGIELRGNAGRTDQIAEHHREVAPLAGGFDRGGDWLAAQP